MANTLQGGTILFFGTGVDQSYGLVQSSTITEQTERAEAKGADGHTQSIQEYNNTKTLALNYLPIDPGTGTKPVIGTVFTFETEEWYITSIATAKTVDGFQTIDIDATNYPNLGV